MKIGIKELTPERWSDLEKLFGRNGACGACWCMYWRALQSLRDRGAAIAEGYPVKQIVAGRRIPKAFAWTGTRPLFEACGFHLAGDPNTSNLRMRKKP